MKPPTDTTTFCHRCNALVTVLPPMTTYIHKVHIQRKRAGQ